MSSQFGVRPPLIRRCAPPSPHVENMGRSKSRLSRLLFPLSFQQGEGRVRGFIKSLC